MTTPNLKPVPGFVGPEKREPARPRILVDEGWLDELLTAAQSAVSARRNNGAATDEKTVVLDQAARKVWLDVAGARYDAAVPGAPAVANGRKDGGA